MEPAAAPPPAGFLQALQNLGDCALSTLQDRLRLLGVELQEEKLRVVQILFWVSAAILAGIMLLIFATLAVASLFWETARTEALTAIAGFYLLALAMVVFGFHRFLKSQPRPFDATLHELQRDRECIRGNS